jgi:SAM-dependent methyltransferase
MIRPRTLARKLLGIPTRKELIFKRIDPRGHGLEIGPSHNPLAPKVDGFDVQILDYTDREGLIRKYLELGVDPGRIEEVDHVWNGEPYADLVGGEGVFDWVISSHSLEHIPDMVGFLLDCRRILKPGGVLALALPDHRFTFDHLRPASSLASVIDAHLRQDRNPTPGTVAEFNLLFARKGGFDSWSRWSSTRLRTGDKGNPPGKARQAMLDRIRSPEYVDVHVWCLTPRSFGGIVEGLIQLGLLEDMELLEPPTPRDSEFFAFLKRTR